MREFMYVQPQIVGPAFQMAYYSDLEKFPMRMQAQRHGLKVLDHDDFWVAEINDGVVTQLFSGPRPRNDQEEISEVNEEFCFQPEIYTNIHDRVYIEPSPTDDPGSLL